MGLRAAQAWPMSETFRRILLPLGPETDQTLVVRAATVFTVWFDAPLQVVCSEEDLARCQGLALSLGVPIEPVLVLEDPTGEGLVAHADAKAPALIVTEPDQVGLALARSSNQPVFLAVDGDSRRMPVGPLVVEITDDEGDIDALATAAIVAPRVGEPIRLVIDAKIELALGQRQSRAEAAEAHLIAMGCDVGRDALLSPDIPPLVLAGRERNATAIVVPTSRLDESDLLQSAISQSVNLLVAPAAHPGTGKGSPFRLALTTPFEDVPGSARLGTLDRAECLAKLKDHTMARIGYIDGGWPIVVPVNYRIHDGDLFIRSLSGGKVRAAERQDTVCLELDQYDEDLQTGWSVVAHGQLEVIADPSVLVQAWSNDPQPAVAADRWQWLRMVPFSMSGREASPS